MAFGNFTNNIKLNKIETYNVNKSNNSFKQIFDSEIEEIDYNQVIPEEQKIKSSDAINVENNNDNINTSNTSTIINSAKLATNNVSNDVINEQQKNEDWKTWTQRDESWSEYKLGNSSETMGKSGCLVTALAIQIARSGTAITTEAIDPGIASQKFKFSDEGYFLWESIENISPNFSRKGRIELEGLDKQTIANKLANYDTENNYFILKVNGSGSTQHYVAVDYIDYDTNEIYIIDPLSSKRTKLYDYYNVESVSILEKRD